MTPRVFEPLLAPKRRLALRLDGHEKHLDGLVALLKGRVTVTNLTWAQVLLLLVQFG